VKWQGAIGGTAEPDLTDLRSVVVQDRQQATISGGRVREKLPDTARIAVGGVAESQIAFRRAGVWGMVDLNIVVRLSRCFKAWSQKAVIVSVRVVMPR
jgi:hypothetical protein